jgi:AcrR family transcriptional regulator
MTYISTVPRYRAGVAERSTREALLAEGALLFARQGVAGVTARQLHDAIGARNESALHYHFGDRERLVAQIVLDHLHAIEERRAPLVAAIEAEGREGDLRALVHALAAPMAADLGTEIGRAHLRVVAQVSAPELAYETPFQVADLHAGRMVVAWLREALADLPDRVRVERLAALRAQLISLFGLRAQLLDDLPPRGRRSRDHLAANDLFLSNLLDLVVAGLAVQPSAATVSALADLPET